MPQQQTISKASACHNPRQLSLFSELLNCRASENQFLFEAEDGGGRGYLSCVPSRIVLSEQNLRGSEEVPQVPSPLFQLFYPRVYIVRFCLDQGFLLLA